MRAVAALALSTALSVCAAPAFAQGGGTNGLGAPSGTLTISAHAAALGVGYSWGDGLLRYRGHTYHFTVNGISVLDVGIANVQSRGRVYNLNRVQDFTGTYGALTGEATAGNGIGGQILRNANGVQVRIDQKAKGARLQASAGGVEFTLKQ